MTKSDGTDDNPLSRMFENGNRIRFDAPVDRDGRNWWLARFHTPHGLTPEAMGDLLTQSASGEKTIRYAFIDGVGQAFRLRVEGSSLGAGEVWFVERTFELQGNLFNADEMFIPPSQQAGGKGRQLMGDLIDAAQRVHADRIKIQARNIGRYAWLRMGFQPDAGSWRDLRKSLLAEVYRHEETLGVAAVMQMARLIAQGGPETANLVAAFDQLVPSSRLFDTFGRPVQIPLGRALFLDAAGDWDGEFVIANSDMMRIAQEYLLRGKHG